VDNGASGRTVSFWTSTTGVTYTQLGTDVVSATATSIYNATSAPYTIFGRASIELWAGKIFYYRVKSGLGAAAFDVIPPHLGIFYFSSQGPDIAQGGSPVINIFAGGWSGSDLANWTDATRLSKVLPDAAASYVIVSLGHNEGSRMGSAYTTRLASLVSAIRTRCPNAGLGMIGQNPTFAPAGYLYNAFVRQLQLAGYCRVNAHDFFDVRSAFIRDGRPLSDLINPSDGVHPIEAGNALWGQFMGAQLVG
jgi:lysophospholipase L1-like esterase